MTREGVCLRAHGPAHPLDGSQPRRWARRTFLNGKSDDRCEGAPTPPARMCHSHLPDRRDASLALVCLCSLCAGDVRRRLRRRRPHRFRRLSHSRCHSTVAVAAVSTAVSTAIATAHRRRAAEQPREPRGVPRADIGRPPAAWGRPNGRRGSRGCGWDGLQMRIWRLDVSFCRCCPCVAGCRKMKPLKVACAVPSES